MTKMEQHRLPFIIIGGGGHACVVLSMLRALGHRVHGFTDVDPEDENSGIELEGYNASLSIFAKQKNTIKIKPQDLEDYYGWDVSVKKEGQLWAEIDLEDLADFILSPRSEYKDSLVKGQEYMWDYYDISAYYPDIISLFN